MDSTKDLCKIPAGKPSGGKYNFIDPPSLGPTVIAVGTTLLAISIAFTGGRLFINRSKLHSADCETLALHLGRARFLSPRLGCSGVFLHRALPPAPLHPDGAVLARVLLLKSGHLPALV